MSQNIWKAVLSPAAVQEIEVPEGAELLTAREQHEQICIWFKCDPGMPMSKRLVAIVGTGHSIPGYQTRYLGTCALQGGYLMFHVFECA